MIRFDRDLLERVDAAAKRRGFSRSAWVQYTVSRALGAGEGVAPSRGTAMPIRRELCDLYPALAPALNGAARPR